MGQAYTHTEDTRRDLTTPLDATVLSTLPLRHREQLRPGGAPPPGEPHPSPSLSAQ